MALQFEMAGSQIDGARDYQEDAFLITNLTDSDDNPSALIIVADGMGGHAAGNVASNMAVQGFNKHATTNYPTDKPADVLHECVIKANNSIKETIKETPALAGMGCTMVAAIFEADKLWWASVGDSHIYLLRDKKLIKKNADHSYGAFLDRMEAAGTPVEPEPGLARNMLMSAVMGDEIDEIDVSYEPFDLQAGDRIMICSDGMDTLSEGKFLQFSDWSETPKECTEALLNAVTEANMPKQDNTTIVVVDIIEKEATAVPPPQAAEPLPPAQPDVSISADTTQGMSSESEEKKSKTGMIIGIAAAIIIVAGISIFMMSGKEKTTPKPIDISLEEGVSDDEVDEVVDVENEEVIPDQVEQTEVVPSAPTQVSQTSTINGNELSDTLKDGTQGPVLVIVSSGSFDMGSPGSSRFAEERPRHNVKVDKFAISKFEVTFEQYEKFAVSANRKVPDNLYMDKVSHPVIFVTWDDAFYYAKWLSEQTGEKYSLPSESQWEYAAGTGKRSPYWWGYDEEPNRAHCFGCGTGLDPRKPTKIGSFGANSFGLYDSGGNVSEWVRDCWHDNYNGAPSGDEVWEGGDCAYRIVRGGSYSSPPQSIRHAKRDKFKSDEPYDNIGIRIIREMD